jgi:hypothetical protein
MPKLSSLQIATLEAFRHENAGATGVILEDGQGPLALIAHLTGERLDGWDQVALLEKKGLAQVIHPASLGRPVSLGESLQAFRWCFVAFNGTYGRDDLAAQINQLLDAGQPLDGLVLSNSHLDHTEAMDDLRRLFALVPTVSLWFADADHLFEMGEGETTNAQGARRVAKVFAQLRKRGLPSLVTSCREYLRTLEDLGAAERPRAVVRAARKTLDAAADILFQASWPGAPSRDDFSRLRDEAFQAFLKEDPDPGPWWWPFS